MYECIYLFVRQDRHLVRSTATHCVVVVRLSPCTQPVAGQAGLDAREISQFTFVISRGVVDIGLQRALQLHLLCRGVYYIVCLQGVWLLCMLLRESGDVHIDSTDVGISDISSVARAG